MRWSVKLPKVLLYEGIFWGSLWFLMTYLESQSGDKSIWFYLTNDFLNVICFAAAIHWLNIAYFIPEYLQKDKIWQYLLFLVGFALLVTPIRTAVQIFRYTGASDVQAYLRTHQYTHYLLSFIVAGFSTIYYIVREWARQIQERRELDTRNMQTELNFLKSQINPHFLFNTLNSLYALTLKKSDDAPEIVIKLSEMMRYMLYECNEKQVFVRKELDYIRNYLDLEALRHKKTEIRFDVQGDPRELKIAPLIFIPFIENCFKHGASQDTVQSFVHIHVVVEGEEVNMLAENSKPERLPMRTPVRKSGGIGIVNVRRRLELLYPDGKHSLEISDKGNIYSVNLWANLA
jgi:two-component system, LytTR family, sensor kinase